MSWLSFFRKKQDFFSINNRKELLDLVKKFLDKDDYISKKFEEEYTRIDNIPKEELVNMAEEVASLLRMDATLVYLFKNLQHKNILLFKNENQKKEYKKVLSLLNDIRKAYERSGADIDKLLNMESRLNLSSNYRVSLVYDIQNIELTKNKSRNALKQEFENMANVQIDSDLTVKQDDITIILEKYVGGIRGETHHMRIYHHDVAVAYAYVGYSNRTIEVKSSSVYVAFNAYLEKTILILLEGKFIDLWISDTVLSAPADRLYERLKDKLKVEKKDKRYFISRKEGFV